MKYSILSIAIPFLLRTISTFSYFFNFKICLISQGNLKVCFLPWWHLTGKARCLLYCASPILSFQVWDDFSWHLLTAHSLSGSFASISCYIFKKSILSCQSFQLFINKCSLGESHILVLGFSVSSENWAEWLWIIIIN